MRPEEQHHEGDEEIRFAEIRRAFEALAATTPDLQVADADPEQQGSAYHGGFVVRLGHPAGTFAELRIGPFTAQERISEIVLQPELGKGTVRPIRLHLDDGFQWNEYPFDVADGFARSLLSFMEAQIHHTPRPD